jgi:hypothetical protein
VLDGDKDIKVKRGACGSSAATPAGVRIDSMAAHKRRQSHGASDAVNQRKAQHHGQGSSFPLDSKVRFHSNEGDDGSHLKVLVAVMDDGEDTE